MRVYRNVQISAILAGKLAFAGIGPLASVASPAVASDFNAEKIMKQMDEKQRYSYLAGVVEGLAVARYMKDGKKPEGMNCIYGWFYDDKSTVDTIYTALEKYGTYTPGAVLDVLTKQKCGG